MQQCATDGGGVATAFLQISAAFPTEEGLCLRTEPLFPLDFVAGSEGWGWGEVPVCEVSGVA